MNAVPASASTTHGPVTQEEIAKKLNELSDREWARFTLCGLPSRLRVKS
jgi:hypothetical protein